MADDDCAALDDDEARDDDEAADDEDGVTGDDDGGAAEEDVPTDEEGAAEEDGTTEEPDAGAVLVAGDEVAADVDDVDEDTVPPSEGVVPPGTQAPSTQDSWRVQSWMELQGRTHSPARDSSPLPQRFPHDDASGTKAASTTPARRTRRFMRSPSSTALRDAAGGP